MTLTPPPVPTRFPCWCRAVYSWGGETKRDLGFIEGDLIECINAGDGSWWTGRLYRDRRTVGVFPSNFVQVLPDDFRPTSRSVSPLPASNTPSPKSLPQKARTFRKPFEAYSKAPHYTTAKQPEQYRSSPAPSREPSFNTASQQEPRGRLRRADSPAPPRPMSSYDMRRAASPAPPPSMLSYDMRRAASPAPPDHGQVYQRDVSPIPPLQTYPPRATSPAPPAHSYQPRAVSPAPPVHSYAARAVSPAPPTHSYPARAVSPAPPAHSYSKRGLSPAPSFTPYRPPTAQRQQAFDMGDSPPPPAPPPHRHVARQDSNASYNPKPPGTPRHDSNASLENRYQPYQSPVRPGSHASFDPRHLDLSRHGSNVNVSYDPRPRSHTVPHPSQDTRQQYHTPRATSPCPPSPAGSHMTPSPLREAMDGVIEQLDALGMSGSGRIETPDGGPADPWSPESFDLVSRRSRRKAQERPHTMMGFPHPDEGYETWSGESSQDPSFQGGLRGKDSTTLPDLNNYVDRMEKRFQKLHGHSSSPGPQDEGMGPPPPPPPKSAAYDRPKSSIGMPAKDMDGPGPVIPERKLRHRKSAYDIGREVLGRTFTTKTTSTNSSSGNQSTTTNTTLNSDRSLMSGSSAGAISATSAGSYAMRNRTQSALGMRESDEDRPETPFTGVTYHSSHASVARPRSQSVVGFHDDVPGLGGLVQPKPPKRSIFKKILDSAKTGVASGRSHLSSGGESKSSPLSKSYAPGFGSNAPATTSSPHLGGGSGGGRAARDTARDMGLGKAVDWVQVRRDVNRSNSLSRIEKIERCERAQMLDYPSINAADELYNSIEGDEGVDGMPVSELIDFSSLNLSQVDKNTRFISNLPPVMTAVTLATTYVCRPYRSDVQRLRAIFTYVSEKVLWEEDFEGDVDTGRVIESSRGCAKEVAVLVYEMCSAIGLSCEIVRGYLKTPGEIPEVSIMPRSNHWWNAVAVDGQWRIMDCSLAAPSNPRRAQYSSAGSSTADAWWFLARPTEACWTHIPEHHEQQHICPPVAHEILLNLPCACPPFFRNGLRMVEYNSSLTRIEDLEMVHVSFGVPPDVEVAAEVEVRGFTRDPDGDLFESGETVKKRALAQAEWFGGVKRYTVKALLPGDEGQGVLKVYAGKRGLMHSIKDVPHPLAFALPVIHTGENPAYEFVTRHPTPHAQRHDIYVVQPQCHRLAINNTFVFAIRQHPSLSPSSALTPASNPGNVSPVPFTRPSSAMSMTASSSAAGSNPSSNGSGAASTKKPAKLAIQTPGGKILRLMRKDDRKGVGVGGARALLGDEEVSDGGIWETIIKCSERGTWRGLVLADRTARWCVFAEWLCE